MKRLFPIVTIFALLLPVLSQASPDSEKFRFHFRLEVEECRGDSHGNLNCEKTPFESDSELLLTRAPGSRVLSARVERTEIGAGVPWTAEATIEHDLDATERPYRVVLRVNGKLREPGHLESRFTTPDDLARLTWDSPTIRLPDGWCFIAARVDRPWSDARSTR